MRAVNLIPADSRRGGPGRSPRSLSPVHAVLGLLALAVLFATVYVLSNNTISERKSRLVSLQAEVAQANAQASALTNYAEFDALAQTRAETVREIAASRFDWKAALSDLAKVVPADTSLQSLLGTVATGASAGSGGASGASTSGLRGDIAAPAFEIRGCTATQDDVARLMSRLRLINGVTRVTLADSQKGDGAQSAPAVSSAGTTGSTGGCKPNGPTFDLVIFFSALPSAGPEGVASVTSVPVAGASTAVPGASTPVAASTPAATATPATTTTPGATTTPTATTTPATGTATTQPVSSTTTPSGG